MAKLLKIATLACAGLTAGGLMAGGLAMSGQFGGEAEQVARTGSVTVAVAPPHVMPGTTPAVDLAPPLPNTPPLPQRAPRVAPVDMAGKPATLAAAAEIIVPAKATAVRAGPSEAAPMLYGFPAGRELREIGRDGDFIQVADVESGAQGWIEKTALASSMLTASIGSSAKPAKRVKQAAAEIDTPDPVTAIPQKKKYRPMMLGDGSDKRASSGSKTNFAGFLNRAFR